MLVHAMLCYAMLCYAMICYYMLHLAIPWYALQCSVMSWCALHLYGMICWVLLEHMIPEKKNNQGHRARGL
eukprot:7889618-Pyramimonas_sp.AAC.1